MSVCRRHRRVFALLIGLLVIPLGAAACDPARPPVTTQPPVALGPCLLAIANRRADDAIMTPPYVLTLSYRPSGDEAVVNVTGTGWGPTRSTVTGPGKALDGIVEAETMNNPMTYFMKTVGTYHYHFADGRCEHAFDVEVKPRP